MVSSGNGSGDECDRLSASNDLPINNNNITLTYDVLQTNGAAWGGVLYRGVFQDVNRPRCAGAIPMR
jgi:hypothetical protein